MIISQERRAKSIKSTLPGESQGESLRALIKRDAQLQQSIEDLETAIHRTTLVISNFLPHDVKTE